MMQKIERIVLIGAGNVATHLGKAFQDAGKRVVQVYSRTKDSALELACKLNCDYTINIQQVNPHADLYVFSLADDALRGVLERFPLEGVMAVHTSGSLSIDIFGKFRIKGCVFYPLQTFSKHVETDFSGIPICLEANDKGQLALLHDLAASISNDVRELNSRQREIIHIAAVFACNFANHMYSIAGEILSANNITFDILHPLIGETTRKALQEKPAKAQTGPAIRNDQQILSRHIASLSALPTYQKLYTFISKSIQNKSKS
jgi:predicted short-subunit dehydrogenase-like oxidoreductase (DUF2520 family)